MSVPGRILREPKGLALQQAPLTLPARPADFSGADHDQLTEAIGLNYGPAFRALDAVWMEGGAAYARFRIPDSIEERVYQGIRRLIAIRKENDVFSAGGLQVMDTGSKHVLGFLKSHNEQQALVLANFSESEQSLPMELTNDFGALLSRDQASSSRHMGESSLTIPPYGFLIFIK